MKTKNHLLKILPEAALLFVVLFGAHSTLAAAIEGKVTAVAGNKVTINLEGTAAPAVGDEAEIFFKLAGLDDEVSVAAGKVASIREQTVEITIESGTGTVTKDQLARIKPHSGSSPEGTPTIAGTPSANPSLTGDWVGAGPDGVDKISFSFREDSTLLWVVEDANSARSMRAKYRVDTSVTPNVVEFLDFEEGELKGQTLRGFFELQGDGRLKMDLSEKQERGFSERETILLSRATSPIIRPNKPAPTPSQTSSTSEDEKLVTEAVVRQNHGDEAGALEATEKAIALNPKNANAFFWHGMALSHKKDWSGATADFEKAMALDPTMHLGDLIEKTKAARGPAERAK